MRRGGSVYSAAVEGADESTVWIQDAFDRILTAVEIPVGSCRLGGQPGDGECSDGVDNDGDGKIDFGPNPHHKDPDCDSPTDRERPECSDHVDNDGDGKTDWSRNRFHRDPQCSSPRDDDESNGHQRSDQPLIGGEGLRPLPGRFGPVAY